MQAAALTTALEIQNLKKNGTYRSKILFEAGTGDYTGRELRWEMCPVKRLMAFCVTKNRLQSCAVQ